MPRVADIYQRPAGIDGVPNQTIESADYNLNVADVEADLNLPRPIVAGGTGATSAAEARDNLDAEARGVQVTNYNSHVFESGSFWSNPGATSAPNSTDYFVGLAIVYGTTDANNVFVTARSMQSATSTGWMRTKNGGVWGSWYAAGIAIDGNLAYIGSAVSDMSFGIGGTAPNSQFFVNSESDITGTTLFSVAKTGNALLTGDFVIATATPTLRMEKPAGGQATSIESTKAGGLARWVLALGDSTAESGGNAGSNFSISNYTDAGALLGTPLFITRSTGNIAMPGTTASTSSTTGALTVAGGVGVGDSVSIGNKFAIKVAIDSFPGFGGDTALGLSVNATPTLFMNSSNTAASFGVNADGVNTYWTRAGVVVGNISVTASATAYNTSSDARLKEDLKSFNAGNIIDDTEVYDFKWKSTGERAYGVIAQQAVEVYDTPVFHDEKEDRWFIDYSKYVPILIQEVKSLRIRVAELEGKAGVGVQPA